MGCDSKSPTHPDFIEQAILHFYNENENEHVLQILTISDSVRFDVETAELIQIFRAAALCELSLTDSSYLIISSLTDSLIRSENRYYFQSIKGLIHFRRNEMGESYKSLITANSFKNHDNRPKALNERILARIAFQLDDHENGIRWLALSTRHFNELNLRKSVAVNEKILGRYYMSTGDYDEALHCFLSAEKVFAEFNDPAELFYVYINLIDYHIKTSNYNQAEDYAMKCLEQCNATSDNSMKTLVYNNLGEIAMSRGNYEDAVEHYSRTLYTDSVYSTATIRKINAHIQLSRVFRMKQDFEKSRFHAKQAVLLSTDNDQSTTSRNIYQELALSHFGSGDVVNGMQYLNRANTLSDSIFMAITKTGRAYYNTKVRLIELENDLVELQNQERRKKNTYLTLIALLVLLAIFVSIIYFQQRSKALVLKALAQKNLELLEDERKLNEMKSAEAEQKKAFRKVNGNGKSEQLYCDLNTWLNTNRNYARKELSLEMAAKELGTNRDYLSKAINEHNIRFNDLVNKYRVEEAIRIFADKSDIRSKYGLFVISSEVGFNSNSVFIDAFRKFSGMTPAQFRDSLGQENKL
jgi:AraC-like DNA-binding protein